MFTPSKLTDCAKHALSELEQNKIDYIGVATDGRIHNDIKIEEFGCSLQQNP